MHAVRDVVGEVHHLGLQARPAHRRLAPQPLEDLAVVRVDAELRAVPGGPRPGVLRRRVQAGPGEVEPGRTAVRVHRLGFEPGQQPQCLGVALEPADLGRHLVQRHLAVVPERRVAEVVREARGVDHVGVAAELLAELAPDLRHLERVGEPGSDEVVRPRSDDLRLRGQPAQRRRVHDARPVALERGPGRTLRRLRGPPLPVRVAVPMHHQRG